jgi:hypothetical protein
MRRIWGDGGRDLILESLVLPETVLLYIKVCLNVSFLSDVLSFVLLFFNA